MHLEIESGSNTRPSHSTPQCQFSNFGKTLSGPYLKILLFIMKPKNGLCLRQYNLMCLRKTFLGRVKSMRGDCAGLISLEQRGSSATSFQKCRHFHGFLGMDFCFFCFVMASLVKCLRIGEVLTGFNSLARSLTQRGNDCLQTSVDKISRDKMIIRKSCRKTTGARSNC